jgi:hypothetical protein
LTWVNTEAPIVPEWVDKPHGLIDFGLTTLRPFTAAENFKHLTRRLDKEEGDAGLGVRYVTPAPGVRKRQDGVEVKWQVSRPTFSNTPHTPSSDNFPTGRLDAPFFCHDVTARVVRVPFDDDHKTSHPCKATGIAVVDVLVPPEYLTAYSTLYSNLTGVAPDQIEENPKGYKGVSFKLTKPISQGAGPVIRVRVPTSEEDHSWLRTRGIGIRGVHLSVAGRKGNGEETLASDGTGATISLAW